MIPYFFIAESPGMIHYYCALCVDTDISHCLHYCAAGYQHKADIQQVIRGARQEELGGTYLRLLHPTLEVH